MHAAHLDLNFVDILQGKTFVITTQFSVLMPDGEDEHIAIKRIYLCMHLSQFSFNLRCHGSNNHTDTYLYIYICIYTHTNV
jgi:hypothetical protein